MPVISLPAVSPSGIRLIANTMTKTVEQSEYNVMLAGAEGEVLNFEVLNSTLLSSISVNHVNVLPTNEHAQRVLRRMNITHESLHFARPVVRLSFAPYLIYRVQGFHDTNGDRDQDCFVQGTMVNLDGEILAFYSYLFDYSRSQDLFGEAFRVQSADTAIAALTLGRFRFTTYNRDFNLSRYEELATSEFANSVDSNWHQGLNAISFMARFSRSAANSFSFPCGFKNSLTNIALLLG